MPDAAPPAAESRLRIADSAARRIAELVSAEARDGLMLRISVSGGGCSGFQYNFGFDDSVAEDDIVVERDGVRVVVDEMSLELIQGSEIRYVEDLVGSYFRMENPNATASCGCGTSFAI